MKKWLAGGFLLLQATMVQAHEIKALVNDELISEYDIHQRQKLVRFSSGGKKISEKEALDLLIEECLKNQTAKSKGLSVSDKEVDEAVVRLEQQNQLKKGDLKKSLAKAGIGFDAFKKQTKTDLLWFKLLQSSGEVSRIEVTEAEKKAEKKKIKKALMQEKYYLNRLLFSLKTNQKEADEVFVDLQKGMMPEEVEKKYPDRVKNTGFEWYEKKDLSAQEQRVLKQISAGQMSVPFTNKNKYEIMIVLNKQGGTDKMILWDMARLTVPADKTDQVLEAVYKASSCEDFEKKASRFKSSKVSFERDVMQPDYLPPDVVQMIKSDKKNRLIGPFAVKNSSLFLMRCRIVKKDLMPTDDQIASVVQGQKIEQLSDKILEDTRRSAVIEMKE